MADSIMQRKKECYLCRRKADMIGWKGDLPSVGLHKHHVVFGSADRKVSESVGLWVWVCAEKHHVYGKESPHGNQEVAELLIREGQKAFENKYSHKYWMDLYGKNYLSSEDLEEIMINKLEDPERFVDDYNAIVKEESEKMMKSTPITREFI